MFLAPLLLAASISLAVMPVAKAASGKDDTSILQYIFSLENFQNAFYSQALANVSASQFDASGYDDWVRSRVVQIGQQQATHISQLQTLLGDASLSPCTYSFPSLDPTSLLQFASDMENILFACTLGSFVDLQGKNARAIVASLVGNEARHAAWLDSAALKRSPWSGGKDTIIRDLSVGTSWINPYIIECPSTNPSIAATTYPSATLQSTATAFSNLTISYTSSNQAESLIIYQGTSSTLLSITSGSGTGTVTLPADLTGRSYGLVVKTSAGSNITDSDVVAGPIILNLGVSSDSTDA
ncbi:Ferritin-like superfamily [Phaffia rhodozyma]|uniref:Ferritin-like superfamily n=1 Tax=Phaffia rhodozyma TaxID=264483 RepID=A0A0F7SN79_PHARH|nr:Ferritin-like superfamily [Phaffia rhodozyma]